MKEAAPLRRPIEASFLQKGGYPKTEVLEYLQQFTEHSPFQTFSKTKNYRVECKSSQAAYMYIYLDFFQDSNLWPIQFSTETNLLICFQGWQWQTLLSNQVFWSAFLWHNKQGCPIDNREAALFGSWRRSFHCRDLANFIFFKRSHYKLITRYQVFWHPKTFPHHFAFKSQQIYGKRNLFLF